MTRLKRILICGAVVAVGLVAQVALEAACRLDRQLLRRPLSSLPMKLGEWVGSDLPVTPELIRESNATEYLSRMYESRRYPGVQLKLWANYSVMGDNLRHTPETCLPAGGWTKNESQTRVFEIPAGDGPPIRLSRLGYSQGDLVGHLGFWYYIFGEGRLENYVRSLPITSQSSYGRVTRGSSITIEVFYPGDRDPDGEGLRDFAGALIPHLDPILPMPRANYHLP
jgi:Protein of unknown function (DUF3485)